MNLDSLAILTLSIIMKIRVMTSIGFPVIVTAYEGRIEKYVPRIAVWHHEACRVMTNGDREVRIFLSHPQKNNGFFF